VIKTSELDGLFEPGHLRQKIMEAGRNYWDTEDLSWL